MLVVSELYIVALVSLEAFNDGHQALRRAGGCSSLLQTLDVFFGSSRSAPIRHRVRSRERVHRVGDFDAVGAVAHVGPWGGGLP